MRSSELSLDKYATDKIDPNRFVQEVYDPIFEPYVEQQIALLELGVKEGNSLLLWRDYFPFGTIVGVDIKLPDAFDPGERVYIYEGSQSDLPFLSKVANDVAPEGFDIIIDDASHIGELTKTAFWHLFDNHLKPSGLYVIEDWPTGYWDDWPDGKHLNLEAYTQQKFKRGKFWLFFRSVIYKLGTYKFGPKIPMRGHSYGMVGFIKQLVDEQAALRVLRGSPMSEEKPTRESKFEKMIITPGVVIIKKAVR